MYTKDNKAPDGSWNKEDGSVWFTTEKGEDKQISAGSDTWSNPEYTEPGTTADASSTSPKKLEEPTQIDYAKLLKYQLAAIRGIAGVNQEVMPGMADMAQKLGSSFAKSANRDIASEFYSYLSNVNPNWKQNIMGVQENALNQVNAYASQLMSGTLDQETITNTMNTMAELGYKKGQFGGLASSNVARNLGLTSMQLKQQGAQLMTEGVSALSGKLLSSTMSLMPQLVNAGAMGSQMMGFMAGGLGSGQQGQSGVINAATTNADLAWSSRLSAFNAYQDQWTTQQNMQMYNKAINTQQQNNIFSSIASVAGLGLGLWTGIGGNSAGYNPRL